MISLYAAPNSNNICDATVNIKIIRKLYLIESQFAYKNHQQHVTRSVFSLACRNQRTKRVFYCDLHTESVHCGYAPCHSCPPAFGPRFGLLDHTQLTGLSVVSSVS